MRQVIMDADGRGPETSDEPPVSRRQRPGANRPMWILCGVVFLGLVLSALQYDHIVSDESRRVVFVLFAAMSILSIALPASGPRGQRVVMLPGIGLGAMLLLPPITAVIPLLLANAIYAATREISSARRGALDRGAWLGLATLVSGFFFHALEGDLAKAHPGLAAPPYPTAPPYVPHVVFACLLYGAIYVLGRQINLPFAQPAQQATRSRTATDWRLEALALTACAPVALLMALTYPTGHDAGVALCACLMILLALIAHYGFEVAMLREQVDAMEKLSAVTLSQTNPHRLVERFLQLSARLIACDRATLWLTDETQPRLERVTRQSASPGSVPNACRLSQSVSTIRFGEGLIGKAADRQSPLIVREGARGGGRDESAFCLLLVPLVVGGETIGVAQFERDAPQSYTLHDIARVRSLATQTATTLANIRMHQDVYNQSVTDELTGLYNRRHITSVLLSEHRRAERYGHSISMILLDVDGFKIYNDTYGHPQGDVLLKRLSALLRENVRSVDIVGRWGGEEFIIVMPETTKEEAWRTAERLRIAVASAVFPGHADDEDAQVYKTISLGVATFPNDTRDMQTLIAMADQALYRAKHGGRNQIVVAGSQSSSQHSEHAAA
ncbi:GGDEF domain-containing protein [Capsulimonas corticalis]|uniref:GGDEF domain-containing protein n=1 Tax=Capsulimonas corticalis TaxID=2219043 RepID=UPI002607D4CB|nr:sensor domain-containing diguanylate cyclase [Capsulimonas corticalis]